MTTTKRDARRITREEADTAMHAAARWLAANPNKHIAGALARDSLGSQVPPTDLDAVCFCAAGRFARELNLLPDEFGPPMPVVKVVLNLYGDSGRDLFSINDNTIRLGGKRSDIIEFMRRMARG